MMEWTKDESKEFEWNNKGLYTIIKIVTIDEYKRMQSYTIFKKACDILKTMHKCTFAVKKFRILKLN